MALQDPSAGSGDPFLDWYYSQANQQASVPEYPMPGGDQLPPPLPPAPPPPPPPPPPDKHIGPGFAGVTDETIKAPTTPPIADDQIDPNLITIEPNVPAPTPTIGQPRAPSAANMAGDPNAPQSMQPGLGIPEHAFDNVPPLPPTEPTLDHEAGTPFGSPTRLLDNNQAALANLTDDQRIQQQYEALRKMDPVKAALFMADHQQAREDYAAARMAELAKADREQQERNLQARMAAEQKAADDTKQLQSDAMALYNTKIVRDRRSGGKKLGDVLIAALGGLVSARTGGPNVGLQMVMKGIDDDIQDQKDEIAHKQATLGMRRNFIADQLAQGKDLYTAQETYRQAVLEGHKQDLISDLNKFDPNGTQAIRRYQMVGQIEGEQRKAIEAFQKNRLDEAVKMADLEGKVLDNAKKRGALGGGSGSDQLISDGATVKNGLGIAVLPPGAFVPPKGWKGSIADYQKLASAGKAGQEAAGGGKVGEEQRQQKLERGGMPIKEFDGEGNQVEWIPRGSQPAVDAFRSKFAATKEAVRLLDEAMAVRTGWTSDTGNSAENQRLHSIMGKAMLTIKNAEKLGQITATDQDLIAGALGTTDFTKRKGMSDAVDQARKNLVQSLKVEAEALGLSPRAQGQLDFPNLYAGKHIETVDEKNAKQAKGVDDMRRSTDPSVISGENKLPKRDPETGKVLFE